MEKRAVRYFLDATHPITGQVLDKAPNFVAIGDSDRVASIASTGFGMAVLANASQRGLVPAVVAQDKILRGLKFARDHVGRRKGWFLHFYDWETGERRYQSEYSTIDTALFLGGALYAAAIFPGTEIEDVAYELYRDADFWDSMTDGGSKPWKRSLSMAYNEGRGYTISQWDMYAEQMLLILLGLGHPTNPLPKEAWLAFERDVMSLPHRSESMMGLEEALFVHQYSQVFVDFRNFQDGFRSYYDNGIIATRLNRDVARRDRRFKTLREGFWGFSAGEAPNGYSVATLLRYNGTVCIGCALGSAMYMPNEILSDAQRWLNSSHRSSLWGKYGFIDSLNLDEKWFSPYVLGITVGPAYMALANLREDTSIWKGFMKLPEIQKAMNVARESSTVNSTPVAASKSPLLKALR
ncbi:MAG: hypothetical protein KF802_12460 [Bdellovibrionaceae bacterium]|nr:hypothetical protein [Pseudobdellovibrionaceae bacterium]MBX3034678.1 hypothetical protein [Pseudobdellovibrionaceae bacterium]